MYGLHFNAEGPTDSEWVAATARKTAESAPPKASAVLFEAGMTFAIALTFAAVVCEGLVIFGIN